jgi:hypothetical protein
LKCLRGEPIPVYGQGENIRDWLYVDDHARGLLAAVTKGRPGRKRDRDSTGRRERPLPHPRRTAPSCRQAQDRRTSAATFPFSVPDFVPISHRSRLREAAIPRRGSVGRPSNRPSANEPNRRAPTARTALPFRQHRPRGARRPQDSWSVRLHRPSPGRLGRRFRSSS